MVNGLSHISDRSGLDMSEFRNSSGSFPCLSSQSGTYPAPGASLFNVSCCCCCSFVLSVSGGGGTVAALRGVDLAVFDDPANDNGLKADAVDAIAATTTTEKTQAPVKRILRIVGKEKLLLIGCC